MRWKKKLHVKVLHDVLVVLPVTPIINPTVVSGAWIDCVIILKLIRFILILRKEIERDSWKLLKVVFLSCSKLTKPQHANHLSKKRHKIFSD